MLLDSSTQVLVQGVHPPVIASTRFMKKVIKYVMNNLILPVAPLSSTVYVYKTNTLWLHTKEQDHPFWQLVLLYYAIRIKIKICTLPTHMFKDLSATYLKRKQKYN